MNDFYEYCEGEWLRISEIEEIILNDNCYYFKIGMKSGKEHFIMYSEEKEGEAILNDLQKAIFKSKN